MAAPVRTSGHNFLGPPGLFLNYTCFFTPFFRNWTEERMENGKVGLGLIGLGAWGNSLATAAARCGEAKVVNGFSRTGETRKAFADKHGCRTSASLDELLSDSEVEGVLIATPHSTHEDVIERAAAAGKHLFVEKPLTLTVAGAKKAIRAAESAGVILQVGFKRRRLGATRRIREMLDKGELGVLHQLEGVISGPAGQNPPQGWRNDRSECPAGGMTTMGVHLVDNFNYLAGPVKRVFAFSKKYSAGGISTTRLSSAWNSRADHSDISRRAGSSRNSSRPPPTGPKPPRGAKRMGLNSIFRQKKNPPAASFRSRREIQSRISGPNSSGASGRVLTPRRGLSKGSR